MGGGAPGQGGEKGKLRGLLNIALSGPEKNMKRDAQQSNATWYTREIKKEVWEKSGGERLGVHREKRNSCAWWGKGRKKGKQTSGKTLWAAN